MIYAILVLWVVLQIIYLWRQQIIMRNQNEWARAILHRLKTVMGDSQQIKTAQRASKKREHESANREKKMLSYQVEALEKLDTLDVKTTR